jgi:hypothetical protein
MEKPNIIINIVIVDNITVFNSVWRFLSQFYLAWQRHSFRVGGKTGVPVPETAGVNP